MLTWHASNGISIKIDELLFFYLPVPPYSFQWYYDTMWHVRNIRTHWKGRRREEKKRRGSWKSKWASFSRTWYALVIRYCTRNSVVNTVTHERMLKEWDIPVVNHEQQLARNNDNTVNSPYFSHADLSITKKDESGRPPTHFRNLHIELVSTCWVLLSFFLRYPTDWLLCCLRI